MFKISLHFSMFVSIANLTTTLFIGKGFADEHSYHRINLLGVETFFLKLYEKYYAQKKSIEITIQWGTPFDDCFVYYFVEENIRNRKSFILTW